MSRALYRLLVHLHPRGFRDRFEDEMLAVYDAAVATHGGLRLVGSTLVSLVGQWLRPSPSNGIAVSAGTMRAYGICRTRQRLELVWLSTGTGILALWVFPLSQRFSPTGVLAFYMALAVWGGLGVLHTAWGHVRSAQEHERANLRGPGFRQELQRKARWYWEARTRFLTWLWVLVLVASAATMLVSPDQRQWNDYPPRIVLFGVLCFSHLQLQRHIGRVLKRELGEVTEAAGPRT